MWTTCAIHKTTRRVVYECHSKNRTLWTAYAIRKIDRRVVYACHSQSTLLCLFTWIMSYDHKDRIPPKMDQVSNSQSISYPSSCRSCLSVTKTWFLFRWTSDDILKVEPIPPHADYVFASYTSDPVPSLTGLFVAGIWIVTGSQVFLFFQDLTVAVELLDRKLLLLQLHPAVLEPDLDLSLRQAQRMRDLDPSLPGQVVVELELLLQLQGLVAAVRLSSSSPLSRVGTWKQSEKW